ncbi:unnamed protein product [Zymoseptoria tritici ST99CH_3D7]|uniref:Uncharacterized protein n=1 Tax=Zymoseptoria tritici (strain ST99CH_3D7) TaxID=1276538 RepID=A0A1X7RV24_ZYMT9|nr:unnamed protein product [Zymoseptoria tritici ST99CH_3D7]
MKEASPPQVTQCQCSASTQSLIQQSQHILLLQTHKLQTSRFLAPQEPQQAEAPKLARPSKSPLRSLL